MENADKKSFGFLRILLSLVLAAELFFISDALTAACSHPMSIAAGIASTAAVFALLCACSFIKTKIIAAADLIIMLICVLFAALTFGVWRYSAVNGTYRAYDNGKAELFAGKKVMVFAPHEDDDICLIGGVAEEFKRYGSEVKIVFLTNGDNNGIQQTDVRFGEAMAGAALYGVDEDDVIFLGYGDNWRGKHILWSEGDEVCTSFAGKTETYGAEYKAAYKNDVPYTRNNMLSSVKEVIKDCKADILIACDNDYHSDHVCTSIIFEEALGQILREDSGYKPLVLKGFSYFTAYYAEEDFYDNINLNSTTGFDIDSVRPEYKWEKRVRLPIAADSVSRAMHDSRIYRQLKCHRSQLANHHAQSIINGDKVFWQRRTDSLCAAALINTSSGSGEYLNDFKYGDFSGENIAMMYGGVWSPTDSEKSAEIIFKEKTDVYSVVLYDAKDIEANVLDAEISFDDGSVFHTGALAANGAGNTVVTDVKNVGRMTVRLLKTEGDNAGLTEIEAFKDPEQAVPRYIKLTDREGNFVYDYCIDESGEEQFLLWGVDYIDENDYQLTFTGKGGASAEIKDGVVLVSCPKNGSECIVTLSSSDGKYSDTVRITNANAAIHLGFRLEDIAVNNWKLLQNTVTYRLLVAVYHRFGGQNIVF